MKIIANRGTRRSSQDDGQQDYFSIAQMPIILLSPETKSREAARMCGNDQREWQLSCENVSDLGWV
jgi:hypothetical protein